MQERRYSENPDSNMDFWNSLAGQWLALCTFSAEGLGSIPGQGTKIPQDVHYSKKKKQKTFLKETKMDFHLVNSMTGVHHFPGTPGTYLQSARTQ